MKLLHALVVLASAASLAGCDAKYRDVSGKAAYRDLIGSNCELLVSLRAHGVAMKLEQHQKTDWISIWNPGFTGPEVTFITSLVPGTRMHVLAARECANCPFDALPEYQVKVVPEPSEFSAKPAFVRAESFSPQHVRCDGAP
jgi:hypothetical protein